MSARELPFGPTVLPDVAWRELLLQASAPYRQAGRFAWHFARGKLSRDPVFRALLERGEFAGATRVLDIGCGQGLLASLLHAWQRGATSRGLAYTGIDLMSRDIERAETALRALDPRPRFICADMCRAELPASDVVVILDVLHYVDHGAQAALLARVHEALQPQGRLLLRVGDAQQSLGFAISQWVDRVVTRVRGHRVAPTWGRTRAEWTALLESLGFDVEALPMSQGTPFANVLLVCRR